MPPRSVPRDRPDQQHTGPDRPGYHDPLAGIGGAAPAQSALTLRLVLAVIGLVFAVAGIVAFLVVEAPAWVLVLFALVAGTAIVDIVVVARRKHRGEPG